MDFICAFLDMVTLLVATFVALLRLGSATPQRVWQSPELHGVASTPSLDPAGNFLYVPFAIATPFSDGVRNASDVPLPVISVLINCYLCC